MIVQIKITWNSGESKSKGSFRLQEHVFSMIPICSITQELVQLRPS